MDWRAPALIFVGIAVAGGATVTLWSSRGATSARPLLVWGRTGVGPGEMMVPRAVAVGDRCLFVVDKRARIQRFSLDGTYQLEWQTPQFDNGKPTGLSVDRDGNVLVADTHYSRVLRYSPEGKLLGSFGSEGQGPGQFIYPTDVLCDRDGNLYVSEYGGNDRVQKLDRDGGFLAQIGGPGTGPGEFARPMALAIGPDSLLYVADACNHRIQAFTLQGQFVRFWGSVGGAAGQLRYPYDVTIDGDTVVVCEYGNNRLQRFDLLGRSLGLWGTPGSEPGQLSGPWAVEAGPGGRLYVADTGNDRIEVVRF